MYEKYALMTCYGGLGLFALGIIFILINKGRKKNDPKASGIHIALIVVIMALGLGAATAGSTAFLLHRPISYLFSVMENIHVDADSFVQYMSDCYGAGVEADDEMALNTGADVVYVAYVPDGSFDAEMYSFSDPAMAREDYRQELSFLGNLEQSFALDYINVGIALGVDGDTAIVIVNAGDCVLVLSSASMDISDLAARAVDIMSHMELTAGEMPDTVKNK